MSAVGDATSPCPGNGGAFASPPACADDLWRITRLWDSSGSGMRTALLASFLSSFGGRPAVDLEAGLVGGASLLLARFVAALRLNGSHCSGGGLPAFGAPLSPLLAALRVFLRAQQCHRFAAEALEAGALAALLAALRRPRLRAPLADAALRTLSLLLSAGRRFKEAFVMEDGLRVLCELLGRRQACSPAVAGRAERLLLQLHQGNPRTADQLTDFACQLTESSEPAARLAACRLLTVLLPRAPVGQQRAAVAPLLVLLSHPDPRLHCELAEALRVLLATPAQQEVVSGLVALLQPPEPAAAAEPGPSLALLERPCRQAAAVRAAGLLAAGRPALVALLAGGLTSGLLAALASTAQPEAQAAAARLLGRLAARQPAVRARLRPLLNEQQLALLLRQPRRLAAELSAAQAASIRRQLDSEDWGAAGQVEGAEQPADVGDGTEREEETTQPN